MTTMIAVCFLLAHHHQVVVDAYASFPTDVDAAVDKNLQTVAPLLLYSTLSL